MRENPRETWVRCGLFAHLNWAAFVCFPFHSPETVAPGQLLGLSRESISQVALLDFRAWSE